MDRNEAIEIVRKNWPDSGYSQLREALKILIPEFKDNESEDEKIRKALIQYIKYNVSVISGWRKEELIAWLEKQGEQNLANSAKTCKDKQSQPTKYTLEQAARIFLDALSDTPYNNKPVTDAQVITRELLKFLSDAHSYNPNAINEQNSAWSEEDEETLNSILNDLSQNVVPDEEDIQWLKSLKSRYTWKPSDEQMELLREVQQALLGKDCHNRFVNFMYELKKLKC